MLTYYLWQGQSLTEDGILLGGGKVPHQALNHFQDQQFLLKGSDH